MNFQKGDIVRVKSELFTVIDDLPSLGAVSETNKRAFGVCVNGFWFMKEEVRLATELEKILYE